MTHAVLRFILFGDFFLTSGWFVTYVRIGLPGADPGICENGGDSPSRFRDLLWDVNCVNLSPNLDLY